jgi:hypothetical protein
MCFLVIEQLPGTNKACGCDHTLASGGRPLHPMLRSAEVDPDTAFV